MWHRFWLNVFTSLQYLVRDFTLKLFSSWFHFLGCWLLMWIISVTIFDASFSYWNTNRMLAKTKWLVDKYGTKKNKISSILMKCYCWKHFSEKRLFLDSSYFQSADFSPESSYQENVDIFRMYSEFFLK